MTSSVQSRSLLTVTEVPDQLGVTVNPDDLLADAQARGAAASARAQAALARLGAETATRRGERSSPSLTAGLTAAQIERDTRTLNGVLKAWKRKRYRRGRGISTINLPSGRRLVYDWEREGIVR